ncbi:MAG: mannosyltransferase [Marinirhabdus sp.]|nr:mannosyltransferase [Marinirhabdus sp.]
MALHRLSQFKLPKKEILLPTLLSIGLFLFFAYALDRSEFPKLMLWYGILFALFWMLIKNHGNRFWLLAGIGVLFRLLFLPSIPNLSQDFFRFLWDGQVVAAFQNPYVYTPQEYMAFNGDSMGFFGIEVQHAHELVKGMGALNASHFSNYPPINQLFFAIASTFGGNSMLWSVIALRLMIITADIGILYFGKKLLERLKLSVTNIFWYFLNPFIIIELTGNLHFEGVMLFFLVAALYLLHQKKWIWAAVLFALSISVKLLPLMLLPICFHWFEVKDRNLGRTILASIPFYLLVFATVVMTFLPFLSSEFIQNFSGTIALWFQNFEFNASIYYIIRWIGYQTVGWNIIGTVGKILPVVIVLAILALSFFRNNTTTQQRVTAMLFAVSVYFLLSTTVHPWYVATPLLLCVFTNYKFPIVWSFFVMLSYSAYGAEGFNENLWLVAVEYIVVIAFAITEIMATSGERKGNFRVIGD